MTPTNTSGFGLHYTGRPSNNLTAGGNVDQDLAYIRSKGFTRIRLGAPPFDYSQLAASHAYALFVKSRGFHVQWGVCSNSGATTSDARWELFKAAVPNEAQWAQDNGMDAFSCGNEEDLHIDTTEHPASDPTDQANRRTTIRNDLRALSTSVQGIFTSGPVVVTISTGNQAAWITEYPTLGKSDFDRLDFNIYDTVSNFRGRVNSLVTAMGINNIGVTEFNIDSGYQTSLENSKLVIGNEEETYALDMTRRAQFLRDIGMQSFYFFSYTNSSGAVDAFDVRSNTNNNIRLAFESMAAAVHGVPLKVLFMTRPVWSARIRQGEVYVKNGAFENVPYFTAVTSTVSTWINGTTGGSAYNNRYGWYMSGAGGNCRFDNTVAYSGSNSMCLTSTGNGVDLSVINYPGGAQIAFYCPPIKPSTAYTCTFYMKTTYTSGSQVSGNGATIQALLRSGAGGLIGGNTYSPYVTTTTSWTQYSINFTSPADSSGTGIYFAPKLIIFGTVGTADLIMKAWYDDIRLAES